MTYQLVFDDRGSPRVDCIRRLGDDAAIPADPANIDWQAYQAWLKAGNAPSAGVGANAATQAGPASAAVSA